MIFYKKEVPKYLKIFINILIFLYLISSVFFLINFKINRFSPCLCCLILTLLIKYLSKKFINIISHILITSILIFIFFASYLGSSFNFYGLIPHYDDIMHFLSGVLTILLGYDIFTLLSTDINIKINRKVIIIFVFSFTLAVAGIWELLEFSIDALLATNMQVGGLKDTMHDMIDAILASIISVPFYEFYFKRYK